VCTSPFSFPSCQQPCAGHEQAIALPLPPLFSLPHHDLRSGHAVRHLFFSFSPCAQLRRAYGMSAGERLFSFFFFPSYPPLSEVEYSPGFPSLLFPCSLNQSHDHRFGNCGRRYFPFFDRDASTSSVFAGSILYCGFHVVKNDIGGTPPPFMGTKEGKSWFCALFSSVFGRSINGWLSPFLFPFFMDEIFFSHVLLPLPFSLFRRAEGVKVLSFPLYKVEGSCLRSG